MSFESSPTKVALIFKQVESLSELELLELMESLEEHLYKNKIQHLATSLRSSDENRIEELEIEVEELEKKLAEANAK